MRHVILFALLAAAAFADVHQDMNGAGASGLFCGRCHRDFALNAGIPLGGSLSIEGLPEQYTPGQTYELSAVIQQPGMSSWGFDAWVTDENGATAGSFADFPKGTLLILRRSGVMHITNESAQRERFPGVFDGPVSWPFTWTAPDEDAGPITFLIEGIAGNNDGSQRGDYRYFPDAVVVLPSKDFR